MNKNIIYSLGLIIIFVGLGVVLLGNRVRQISVEQGGPIPGATNIDVSDIQVKNQGGDATLSPEAWDRINSYIKKDNEIRDGVDSSYKTLDYTAPDSNGNDYAVDSDHKKINQPTQEENKLLKETMKWANEAAPVKRIVIDNLRKGNIENLIALTHPDVVKDNGVDVIRDSYIGYIDYFKDFKFLDEDNGTLSRLLDHNGSVIGLIFEEHFDTTTGNKKFFTITMMPDGDKYYVAELVPKQTIKDIDERNNKM